MKLYVCSTKQAKALARINRGLLFCYNIKYYSLFLLRSPHFLDQEQLCSVVVRYGKMRSTKFISTVYYWEITRLPYFYDEPD